MAEMIHGGRLVARALKREGVEHLFTLCGGHIAAIYDGCLDEGIRVVDTRHEQTAAHAADGYARLTGRPGVVAVTAGPGLTDAVTAVATAYRSGVPMVVLGGAGPRVFRDMGSLQDMDHVELMRPITKWAVSVQETRRLGEYVTAAFRKAMSGVPGPVFLELPLDLLMEMVDAEKCPIPTSYRTDARPAPDPEALARALELLRQAERPMAIVGSQLRWSREPVETLAAFLDATGIPTFVNGMARGMIDPSGPHFLNRSRKYALKNADLVLIFGTPFDFRLSYGQSTRIAPGGQSGLAGTMFLNLTSPVIAANARVIQVDLDGDEVGRNRTQGVDVGIVADSGLTLAALTAGLGDLDRGRLDAWNAAVRGDEQAKWDKMGAEIAVAGDPPNPLRVCHEVGQYLRPGDVVIGDGGDFVGTAAYVMKPFGVMTWMDPGPLGTLGVGPGFAMAAKLLRPDARVIVMFGDGSFGLHAMEIEAMARQGIQVVAVIGNDAGWTQILRGQKQLYGAERVVATELDYTHYERVAEACGGHGEWVETTADLAGALERAFASDKPAVVNVKIAKSSFRSGAISV
ncbi:MAG: thiamine pyrophosphate-binding protein [Deltaproteobacteria bacterium]|nr:MAG: thiamine pyrophosphate-binding protein [Deltaproteobacteria bacterium]